ncbi:MAG: acyl carrier protein [Longimicrobiales bacterium]
MTRSLEHARFMSELLAWVRTRLAPDGEAIDADTSLFEDGRIDSIRILELIAWTERELGRTIPDRWIRMDYFATVRRIADTFVGEGERALG